MNIIFIRSGWGQNSTEKIVERMQEPCVILAQRKNGKYRGYVGTEDRPTFWRWAKFTDFAADALLDSEENNIINWGTALYGDIYKLNCATPVAKSAHKGFARRLLAENGVRIPKTESRNNLELYRDMNYPVIVRPSHHHGGQDFYVFNTLDELRGFLWGKDMSNWYVSEIFEKSHEFRYHVAHGKILFVQEKPLKEGEIRGNYAVNEDAWRVLPWKEFHTGMAVESIKAVEVLGLDFGAVDVLYNSTNNTWAVCEVNTAPSSASEYASRKYAAYFDWCIRHEFPEHFELQEDGTNVFYSKLLRE